MSFRGKEQRFVIGLTAVICCACASPPSASSEGVRRARAAVLASEVTYKAQPVLVPNDGASGDSFGEAVAIDGDVAVVGAFAHAGHASGQTDPLTGSGSAYVWRRNAGTWVFEQELYPSDAAINQGFGYAVAVQGNTLAVTALNAGQGAVYVFSFDAVAAKWDETAMLPGDGVESLGASLSLRGNQLLMGAPQHQFGGANNAGAVYLATRTGSVWSKQLLPFAPEAGDRLGGSVALGNGVVAAGARAHAGFDGIVWLLSLSPSSTPVPLVTSDPTVAFGTSVAFDPAALETNVLAVGASNYTDPVSGSRSGAVYLFSGSSTTWAVQQTLVPPDGQEGDSFGTGVALSSDVLLAASPSATNGNGAGYLYLRDGASWSGLPTLTGDQDFAFAQAVALSGRESIIGSFSYLDAPGEAVVLSLSAGSVCVSDGDCALGHCSEGVCCDAACTDACHSCLKKNKDGGDDGTCGAISKNTDPRDQCADSQTMCGTTGLCDGSGACAFHDAGLSCGSAICSAANEVETPACDGHGACVAGHLPCGFFRCSQGVCSTSCSSVSDCIGTAYCDTQSGSPPYDCKPLQPVSCNADGTVAVAADGTPTPCGSYGCVAGLGCLTACMSNQDCAAGFSCSEGVCCDQPCRESCNSCLASRKASGPDGICGPIKKDSPPKDGCVDDSHSGCGYTGSCDGSGRCAYVPEKTQCKEPPSCSSASTATSYACDGHGTCNRSDTPCGPFRCDGNQCFDRCDSQKSCDDSAYCDVASHQCQPHQEPKCSDDHLSAISDEGTLSSCSPFVCANTKCLKSCRVSEECAEGFCQDGTCATLDALGSASSSCALRARPRTDDSLLLCSSLGLVCLFARRTRIARVRARPASMPPR